MKSGRTFLALATLAVLALASPARAFEFHPYVPSVVAKAIASGEPVVVHVYAPWCLQCHAQAEILDRLKNDPSYNRITFFRVDYDN
jgi:thiol-disulfide isomerase/thioredoxin